MSDELSGNSLELPGDYILGPGKRGTNQLLSVPQHDAPEVVEIVPGEGSRIAGQLLGTSGPAFGPNTATKANPLGAHSSESLNQ